ncbi:MAG: N-acetylmuramoyl-L-alanine amidase [Cetobacterium sp.]
MKNYKIALIIGHNEKSKGAYSVDLKTTEFDFYSDVVEQLFVRYQKTFNLTEDFIRKVKNHIAIFRIPNTGYSAEMSEVIKELKEKNFDLAIEMHFNATANSNQNGSTVLHWHKSEAGKKLAELFQNILLKETGIRKLDTIKITSTSQNGGYGIVNSKCPYILIEPFFGDNKTDTSKISISLMVQVLFNFLNTINEVGAVEVKPTDNLKELQEENKKLKKSINDIKEILKGL